MSKKEVDNEVSRLEQEIELKTSRALQSRGVRDTPTNRRQVYEYMVNQLVTKGRDITEYRAVWELWPEVKKKGPKRLGKAIYLPASRNKKYAITVVNNSNSSAVYFQFLPYRKTSLKEWGEHVASKGAPVEKGKHWAHDPVYGKQTLIVVGAGIEKFTVQVDEKAKGFTYITVRVY